MFYLNDIGENEVLKPISIDSFTLCSCTDIFCMVCPIQGEQRTHANAVAGERSGSQKGRGS